MPVEGALNAPGLIAEVTNTVLFHATGDDQPRPLTSTLHATLSFVDHVVGNLPSRMPAPAGRETAARPPTAQRSRPPGPQKAQTSTETIKTDA